MVVVAFHHRGFAEEVSSCHYKIGRRVSEEGCNLDCTLLHASCWT